MATTFNMDYPMKINSSSTNTAGGVNLGPVQTITDIAGGGTIGSAATTVDVASVFNINQTTAAQTLTVPAPTVTTDSKTIIIANIGSTSFTVLSTVIAPGAGILCNYSGAWNVVGTSSGATNVTVAGGKTFTVSNTLTLAGTDGTTMTFPSVTGTVVTLAGTQTLTNKTLTSPSITSATMTTPSLGVATATSVNGLTITTSTGVVTITNGKTLAVDNTLEFAGTDSTVMTFPSTSQTIVGLTAVQTLTNKTFTTPVIGVATGTSLAVTGLLTSSGTAGIGYATGAGGTVTQATNKSTTVVLNKTTGAVTMNNASLAGAATVTFTMTNSTIAAGDVVHWSVQSGASTGIYNAFTSSTGSGTCTCSVTNVGATASEAVVLNFVVIKGVAA